MSNKTEITVHINKDLYLNSKNYLDMSLDSFIEYCLSLYISSDDNYAKTFKKGCKLYNELDKIKQKLYEIEKKNDEEDYTDALVTINRIHDKLGYIGKNQIRKVAHNYDLNPKNLIEYLSKNDYTITNFGDAPKRK